LMLPFGDPAVNEFVSKPETVASTLFLATGGNGKAWFPLDYSRVTKKFGYSPSNLPNSLDNTILVGGCNTDRSKHSDRGYGPGVDVMVPGDKMSLYVPKEIYKRMSLKLLLNWRQKIITLLTEAIRTLTAETVDEADVILGQLPITKRMIFNDLDGMGVDKRAEKNKEDEYRALLQMSQPQPNPKKEKLKALQAVKDLIEQWDTASWAIVDITDDRLRAWMENFVHLRLLFKSNQLADDNTTATWPSDPWSRLKNLVGIGVMMGNRLESEGDKIADRYRIYVDKTSDLDSDTGVSFGLPIVSNIAGKLKMIRSTLTPNDLKRILIDTSDYDSPEFQNLCLARGIVNPLRAYYAAYDDYVFREGRDVRDPRPLVEKTARKIFYTFYYMNREGLALYESIKGRLNEEYARANIELIEAESPVEIDEQDLTYVTDKKINEGNWSSLINPTHVLSYAPRHLRLILVNECGHVFGQDVHRFVRESADQPWVKDAPAQQSALSSKDNSQMTSVKVLDGRWQCTIEMIGRPESRFAFPTSMADIVDVVRVGASRSGDLSADKYDVIRTDDQEVTIRLTREASDKLDVKVKNLFVRLNVVQRLGGSRSGESRNIFMTNRYHQGPNGTAEANSSALVLFLHEIGHAIGMVPPEHAHHYDEQYGGEGNHCGINTQTVANNKAPDYGVPADSKGTNVKVPVKLVNKHMQNSAGPVPCVMYHTRTSIHHSSKFCDTCIETMKSLSGESWEWSD
jgi:hypothetical protein